MTKDNSTPESRKTEELKTEIQSLRERLAQLEDKVRKHIYCHPTSGGRPQ